MLESNYSWQASLRCFPYTIATRVLHTSCNAGHGHRNLVYLQLLTSDYKRLLNTEPVEATKIWVCSLVCNYMFLGQNLVFTKGWSQKVGVQLHTLHTRFRRPWCMFLIRCSFDPAQGPRLVFEKICT